MKKKILIVDDDADLLEPIALILESNGYSVESTTKGEQAHTKLDRFKPDLVLLDILMSGSDGRKICSKIKEDSATQHIPIVMMSAHPGADLDSEHCGANDFIAKPFETKDLTKVIKKNLQ